MNRRHFIKSVGLVTAAGAATPQLVSRLEGDVPTANTRREAARQIQKLSSEQPVRTEIRVERGGPRLFVNGRETYPLLALSTHLYPTIDNFRKSGIHLYHPLISGTWMPTAPTVTAWSSC